jgi:hypothetical protein
MNNIYHAIISFLFASILLSCINQVIIGDPYVKCLCTFDKCSYCGASSSYTLCTGDTKELYAICPGGNVCTPNLPCLLSGTFQWYTKDFYYKDMGGGMMLYGYWPLAIAGATTVEYIVTEAGPYWCNVNCGSGVYQTDTVEFTFISYAPSISEQPVPQNICISDIATFTVNATNNISYLWQKKVSDSWTNISGATSDTYSYTPLMEDNSCLFRCMISNPCDVIYSDEVMLTINSLPTINFGADKHICDGSEFILNAGDGFEVYSWNTGATTQTISVNAEDEYSVAVTDNNGCSNSDTIYIYIDPPIPSLDQGADKYTCPGEPVNLIAAAGYDNYLWSTNADIQSVVVTDEGTYSVQVSNNGNVCIETDTINVIYSRPFEDEEIGMVTVDLESGDNLVIWERTLNKGTDYYEIYRGSEGNELYLGKVDFEAVTVFRDIGTFDDGVSYRYKILVVDTCGNKSEFSSSHKTMHLTASKGTANEVNLAWNHYEGFPVAWYYIYRGTDSANLQLYDSIQYDPTTISKTDYNPPAGITYYRIGVKAPKVYIISSLNKADSGPYSHSMSNIEDNRFQTGFKDINTSVSMVIYPNPSTDQTTVSFPNPEQKKYELIVRDLSGKLVLVINNITQDKVTIEGGSLKAGFYSIEIVGDNIYRGKLIVE